MNRKLPRRRDLTQIPEDLRTPLPLPRSEQTEVILSESYHTASVSDAESMDTFFSQFLSRSQPASNPVHYPASYPAPSQKSNLSSTLATLASHYPVIQPAHPSATELALQGKSYVFVILRHIKNPQDNDMWISSYNSVRRYYTNRIVIIDDNSARNTVNGKLDNAEVIHSDFPGAGEILPYYYFMKNRWADRMIFLHDSMFLHRPFHASEVDKSVAFHWYFTSNGNDYRPALERLIPSLRNNEALLSFLKDSSSVWRGCFGATTTIDLSLVEELEEKYKLFSAVSFILRSRKDRETFERLLGLVLFYEKRVTAETCSTFGDILSYPNAFQSNYVELPRAKYHMEQAGYDSAIIKVWRGR